MYEPTKQLRARRRLGNNLIPYHHTEHSCSNFDGAFLSFAIVLGEFILARYLVKPASAPYMLDLGQNRAYEPAALAVISFALTWACMGIITVVGRGSSQAQVGGGH